MKLLSEKSLKFLFENKMRNSKEWYDAHKHEYREYVVEPLANLVNELAPSLMKIDRNIICSPKIGGSISRIRRDTRFSNDKTLYRDVAWIVFIRDKKLYNGLPGYFLEIAPNSFRYGCGYYSADTKSLESMRSLIIKGDKSFKSADRAYRSQNIFDFEGEMYKRNRFSGYSPEEQNWLNRRNIDFIRYSTDFELLYSEKFKDTLIEGFEILAPIYKFLIKAEELKAQLEPEELI